MNHRKGVTDVPEAPSHNRVVVQSNWEGHDHTGHSDAHQEGMEGCPGTDRSSSQPLANGQLHQEQGHALEDQHDHVRNEEGSFEVIFILRN